MNRRYHFVLSLSMVLTLVLACGPFSIGLSPSATGSGSSSSKSTSAPGSNGIGEAATQSIALIPNPLVEQNSPVSTLTTTPFRPTLTTVPSTSTPTTPPNGIRGIVKYTGTKTGSILVFVGTQSGSMPTGEQSTKNFPDIAGGEFLWGLPAGSYYVSAIMQVAGPPSLDFPFITCGPIEVASNVLVNIEIALTDLTLFGKPRDCSINTP
jgi:hypothetical protein